MKRINHATHSKSFSSGGAKFKETQDRFTAHGGIARGKGRKGNRTRQTGGGDEDFLEVRQRRRARGGGGGEEEERVGQRASSLLGQSRLLKVLGENLGSKSPHIEPRSKFQTLNLVVALPTPL